MPSKWLYRYTSGSMADNFEVILMAVTKQLCDEYIMPVLFVA